jgi:hypothetical protein
MLFAPLLLAACGGPATPAAGEPDNRIECRAGSASAFERTCTIEIAQAPDGMVFTLRKADGGFRRLLQTIDHNFVAADGAEQAHVTIIAGNRIEIEIGGDRFRLPARVRP